MARDMLKVPVRAKAARGLTEGGVVPEITDARHLMPLGAVLVITTPSLVTAFFTGGLKWESEKLSNYKEFWLPDLDSNQGPAD